MKSTRTIPANAEQPPAVASGVTAGFFVTMKTITVKQPWAWFIVQGFKDVENRTWSTRIRGRVLIHAAASPEPDMDEIRDIWNAEIPECPIPDNLPLGGIGGSVEIVGCVRDSQSDWAVPGQYHWLLQDAEPLAFKAARGKLGFWEFDEKLL